MDTIHQEFINQAIALAHENVVNKTGGPFGALIVSNGNIIGKGVNRVTEKNDPTAHAEVQAIRDACETLNNFRLDGAVIYSSCEPCPMCLSAIYWARIDRIYYAAGNQDASRAGFDDSFIYKEVRLPVDQRSLPCIHLETSRATLPFDAWMESEGKIEY